MSKERKKEFLTHSQLPVKTTYTQEDLAGFNPSEALGLPGKHPFTRGIYPNMYRGKLWTMRQYAGFATAEDSNKRYRYLLSQGQTGVSVAFDLPTQLGLDSDNPLAQGEVGKVGVAIDSILDMDRLFFSIPLEEISVSMTINATAAIVLAMYLAVADSRGFDWKKLSGTIQNDILKEYIARGTYIFPPGPSLRLITDTIFFCQNNVPRWNTMSISGYHIREAGATAVQELAFTLANATAYLQAAVKAGLEPDSFAPRLSFFLAAHNNFFEEVAKFRAARRIWAKIMKDRFRVKNPNSCLFRFHTQTSGATLAAQSPENNVVRVALQALSSVLGGTQSLHTNSRDEALSLPSEESARIALRTQQIIAYESGVADTVDPLGGSYFVETLTNQLEERVWQELQKIEDMGGVVTAIEQGYIQKEIQESAYAAQKLMEKGENIVVGLNKFKDENKKLQFDLYYPPEEVESAQKKRLHQLRQERNNQKVDKILAQVQKAAGSGDNLFPPIFEAVKSLATLGEITEALKKTMGVYRELFTF